MPLIHINSAACGAGKTRATALRAIRLARDGERVLIVQPTLELIDQTVADEIKPIAAGVRVTAIHGENSETVVRDIVRHLREPQPGGEILLITHSAHERLPHVPASMVWHLIYDEVPQTIWSAERNLTRNHRLLLDGVTAEPSEYPEYVRIRPANAAYLGAIVRNAERDDVDAVLAEIAAHVTSRHWHVYADAEQFGNLTAASGDEKRRKLILHGVMQPSLMDGYKSVTILGADVGESALAYLWSRAGVTFREDRRFDRDLRFTTHQNGDLIDIYYLSSVPWSKRFRDSEAEGQKVLDLAAKAIIDLFGDEPFAFLANKDVPHAIWKDAASRASRLPNIAHGNNAFQHLHNVALLSALNPTSGHFAFLDTLSMDSDDVKTAVMRSALYQAACRISLRNPDDRNHKRIVVPDLDSAVWLEEKFPGANVLNLLGEDVQITRTGSPGRPKIHACKAVVDAMAKQVEYADWSRELTALVEDERKVSGCENPINIRDFAATKSGVQPVITYATVYDDFFSNMPSGELTAGDWPEFVSSMHDLWSRNTLDKADNLKFVPAVMSPGGKSESHAIRSRMIVLDVDDGDLSPQAFADMFPRVTMLFVNTASNTASNTRYRVFVPLDVPVPPALYRDLVARMVKRMTRSGYWSRKQLRTNDRIKSKLCHGIDTVKVTAASLLNLPSQPDDPDGALFLDLSGGRRKELDVMEWIARGNPRKRTVGVDRAIVVTPEDRAAEAQADARLFDALWSDRMGGDEVPEDIREAVFETWRTNIYEDDDTFWRNTKDFVERISEMPKVDAARASFGGLA